MYQHSTRITRGQRTLCEGGISERGFPAVESGSAACDRSCRYVLLCIWHRRHIGADTSQVPQDEGTRQIRRAHVCRVRRDTAAGRTVMKRSMIVFHIITWQLIFVLIPDIRQAMGADISTLDYVFSQASGNTACLIWLVASFVYSKRSSN